MDNSKEIKELQPKPERVITLGEEFHPFDPAENQIEKGEAFRDVNQLSSRIILFAGTNLKFPLRIIAFPGISPKTHAITPFDPEVGYQITYEDLNWQSRIKKLERLSREKLGEFIEFSKAPLYLKVTDFPFKWTSSVPEERAILDSLRLFVWFPKGSFEGKPHTTNVPDSSFAMFYPQDTGPLPMEDISIHLKAGFYLFLPSDPEKLSQIRAMFVLVEEETQGH